MQLLNDSVAENWLGLVVLQAIQSVTICFINESLEQNSHSSQGTIASVFCRRAWKGSLLSRKKILDNLKREISMKHSANKNE